jgi:hypothetical protein
VELAGKYDAKKVDESTDDLFTTIQINKDIIKSLIEANQGGNNAEKALRNSL